MITIPSHICMFTILLSYRTFCQSIMMTSLCGKVPSCLRGHSATNKISYWFSIGGGIQIFVLLFSNVEIASLSNIRSKISTYILTTW